MQKRSAMGPMSAALAAAVVLLALGTSTCTATTRQLRALEHVVRMPRGVRGGEGDNTVEVVASQGWHRHKAPPRELACPRGEVFMDCGSPCPRSCLSIRSPRACPNTCSPGCFCAEGLVRDTSGRCIEEWECR